VRQFAIAIFVLGTILAGQSGSLRANDVADCNSGEPERVIQGCTRLLQSGRVKPVYQADVYTVRGIAFQLIGQLDSALSDFDRAIEINPEHFGAYVERGLIYLSKRRYSRAIPDFDQAIALNPQSFEAFSNRGTAYQGLGIFGRAIADMTKALALRPNHPLVLNNRAYAYSLNGEQEKALADIRAALALEPDNARMHHSLGEIYFYAGQEDKATEEWEAVCRLASEEVNRMWQRNLAVRGHYSGDIDGMCDERLIDAFRSCAREKCFLHS